MKAILSIATSILFIIHSISALQLDLNDHASIRRAASTVAHGMMEYYTGNQTGGTPGLLPAPYYWWQSGAMFGGLVDYWYYTGNTTYNDVVSEAILGQASPERDFMPVDQAKDEGNDDQAFWGMTAMSAAEVGFPDPPSDQPQWLSLAQGVFNSQVFRWDNATCGGGLRWQIFSFNLGYTYKNSISQGGLFNLAARLGAYTKNQTYFQWAEKTYDWCETIGLISPGYSVFDGSDSLINCTQLDPVQWSYNFAIFLHGAAVMWNQTTGATQQKWGSRVEGLLKASNVFFTGPKNNIMIEIACERNTGGKDYCDTDQLSFKAYLSRWMAGTAKVAPWTYDTIVPYLQASALAAAQSCSGGSDGVTCGNKWWVGGFDNLYGVGQQMSALEVIQSNLLEHVQGPMSSDTGGTSSGNASAGTDGDQAPTTITSIITTADRVGAGVLTALLSILTLSGAWWIVS